MPVYSEYTEEVREGEVHVKRYSVPLVFIGESKAVPGEKGLFADRDMYAGFRIGVFEGIPVGTKSTSNAVAALIIPGLGKVNIDGRQAGPPYLAMINDAQGTQFTNNATIKPDGSVSAIRDIQKGSEILMDYGSILKLK